MTPLLSAILIVVCASTGQFDFVQPDTHQYTTLDGLPQISVRAIAEAPDGSMWFATLGGLARLDGDGWTVYDVNSEPPLPGSRVTALHITDEGVVMGGCDGSAVFSINGESIITQEIDAPSIHQIVPTGLGRWYVPVEGGLVLYTPGPRTPEPIESLESPGTVVSMARNTHRTTCKVVLPPAGNPRIMLRRLGLTLDIAPPGRRAWSNPRVSYSRDRFFIIDEDMLAVLDDSGNAIDIPLDDAPRRGPGVAVLPMDDEKHLVVFADAAYVLEKFLDVGSKYEVTRLDIEFENARAACIDSKDSIWIGTETDGVYVTRPSVAQKGFLAQWSDNASAWLYARAEGGEIIAEWQGAEPRHDAPLAFDWNHHQVKAAGRNSRLYGAIDRRIFSVEEDRYQTIAEDPNLRGTITALAIDNDNTIWAGTTESLFTIENNRFAPVRLTDAEPGPIQSLVVDWPGNVWAATDTGLWHANAQPPLFIPYPSDMPSTDVRSMTFGTKGELYIATYGAGVYVLETQRFRKLNDLPEDHVNCILIDRDFDAVWILGNRATYRTKFSLWQDFALENTPRPRFRVFDARDGMPEGMQASPAGMLTDWGAAVFSTTKGAYSLPGSSYDDFSDEQYIPYIAALTVDGGPITLEENTVIPPIANRATFRIARGEPDISVRVNYEVRLEGVDTQWVAVGPDRTVSYSRIPPGKHVLKVRSAVGDSKWFEPDSPFTFTRLPAWHETIWSRTLAVAVIVAIPVIALVYFRRRISSMRGEIQRRKEHERREARFVQELNHRVRNNLGSVLGLIELTMQGESDGADSLRTRVRAMSEVHTILSERDWKPTPLSAITTRVVSSRVSENRLERVGLDPLFAPEVCQTVALIFNELAENAFQHGAWSNEPGIVRISCVAIGDLIVFTWTESEGPAVTSEIAEGNGLSLVRGFVAHELRGTTDVRVVSNNIEVAISAPTTIVIKHTQEQLLGVTA